MSFGLGQSTLTYHASMLGDRVRVERYRAAVQQAVRPGDIVVDIGTGTGLLAFFACQAGAAHVHAIDAGPVIGLARELCARNGYGDRVTFHECRSQDVELDGRADVLVTETLWNFGLGEGMLGSVLDARERLLRPGARIVPESVELVVAPIDMPAAWSWIDVWNGRVGDVRLDPIREYAVNNVYRVDVPAEALLAEPRTVAQVALADTSAADVAGTARCEVTRDGAMHGVAGWFRARLASAVEVTNAPPNRAPSWWHAYLPVAEPRPVSAGDRVAIQVATGDDGSMWSWRVDGGHHHSTVFGMPLAGLPANNARGG